jgi:cell division protein FtsI/penicillin-binding protein 2
MTRREWMSGVSAGLAPAPRLSAELTRIFGVQQGAAVLLDAGSGGVIAAHRLERARTRRASPGSAVKPFTLLALFEQGAVAKMGPVRCSSGEPRCTHPPFSGAMEPAQALAWSCNSWIAQMSAGLEAQRFRALLARFGFEPARARTPEEVRGMALGVAGVRVTALGLAMAYRGLARPGYSSVWKGLQDAVLTGTAQAAQVQGLSVAGKTGTSQDGGEDYPHAWFAGWAPAERPRAAVSVFVERGRGASDAAPLAGAILEAWWKWSGSR